MKTFFWILTAAVIVVGLVVFLASKPAEAPTTDDTVVPNDQAEQIAEKDDLIRLVSPKANATVSSPLTLTGEARGYWFFEASFPIDIVNWDGLIIGSGIAQAQGEWMTEDYVPFTATVAFENPYAAGDPDFMKKGWIILHKDNPSGLPENDNALEVPIQFAP